MAFQINIAAGRADKYSCCAHCGVVSWQSCPCAPLPVLGRRLPPFLLLRMPAGAEAPSQRGPEQSSPKPRGWETDKGFHIFFFFFPGAAGPGLRVATRGCSRLGRGEMGRGCPSPACGTGHLPLRRRRGTGSGKEGKPRGQKHRGGLSALLREDQERGGMEWPTRKLGAEEGPWSESLQLK